MLDKNQVQHVDQQGTAIQAGGNVSVNVTHVGLTRAEAKEIFSELFELNYYKLTGAAQATSRERGEEVTEKFIQKLQEENPTGLQQYADPDFQDALFTVQKEYAKAGDKDLGDILVDLLVDRSKQANRNILQIVLNQCIHTAPKLTNDQLAVLALSFFFRLTKSTSPPNFQMFGSYLAHYIKHFSDSIVVSNSCFQHLVFTGCGSISLGQITLEEIFQRVYPGYFKNGFESTRIDEIEMHASERAKFFIKCLNDQSKFQVYASDMDMLEAMFAANAVTEENRQKISALFNEGTMGLVEIKAKMIEVAPYLAPVFVSWSASQMKNFELSSVGIAIGHANIKRLAGEFANLSIWIN